MATNSTPTPEEVLAQEALMTDGTVHTMADEQASLIAASPELTKIQELIDSVNALPTQNGFVNLSSEKAQAVGSLNTAMTKVARAFQMAK